MVFSKTQEDLLAPIIERIVEKVKPEIIICYGIRTTSLKESGIFVVHDGYREREFLTFDLLIITSDEVKPEHNNVVENAEKEAKRPVKVHCITHKIGYVNGAIRNNVRFFCAISLNGRVVFDRGQEQLRFCDSVPHKDPTVDWDRWVEAANKYVSLAEYSFMNGWYSQTAFLSHQVVESTCIGLLRVFTGYRSKTHNIKRLLKLIQTFSVLPVTIFPGITYEEQGILRLITKAYSDTRYKDGYEISRTDTSVVLARAKLFLSTGEELYKNQISDDPGNDPMVATFELLKGTRF